MHVYYYQTIMGMAIKIVVGVVVGIIGGRGSWMRREIMVRRGPGEHRVTNPVETKKINCVQIWLRDFLPKMDG